MQVSLRGGLVSVDNSFEKNWRRQQELRCRPYADRIYKRVFDAVEITRFETQDDYLLDKEFAMDVRLTLSCGMILTGQEKFLSQKHAKYRSVTVEHMQNPGTGERGDWYKLAVQFYFVGYETTGGFFPWVLLNWPAVVLATSKGAINWMDNGNKDGHARASFKYCYMDAIPDYCVIERHLKPVQFE